jgi:hypothetical protein
MSPVSLFSLVQSLHTTEENNFLNTKKRLEILGTWILSIVWNYKYNKQNVSETGSVSTLR